MNAILKEVLERAENWSEEDQKRLAQIAREIEAERTGVYHATEEELRDIDEGLAEADRGEFASDDEVEAMFAKYR